MSLDSVPVMADDTVRPSRSITRLIARLVPRPAVGSLRLVLPNGDHADLGIHERGHAVMNVHRWRALWRMLCFGEVGFSDGYIAGDWSTPDLVTVLDFFLQNERAFDKTANSRVLRLFDRIRHRAKANTRTGSKKNIVAHYDLGNSFYRCWLDREMNYSSAIYEPGLALEAAQRNKLKRVADYLDLTEGQRVLEIGCGWGALAEYLVCDRNVAVTGLTLSPAQAEYATARLATDIEAGKATIRMQDYRDVAESFDRIVSIEMFEAVGERYWPIYFEKLRSCLVKDGAAVLQIITIEPSRFEDYRKRPDFVQRSIFPGGMLPTRDVIEQLASKAHLEIVGIESFGTSYAKTLQDWRHRFLASWREIEALGFKENFRRLWEYYLAYCEVGFALNAIDVSIFKLAHRRVETARTNQPALWRTPPAMNAPSRLPG